MNDRMETSVPDIYAAGDAVQVKHYVTGNDALISLAGPANKQGRIIADNICGGDSHYLGSQGSSVIKVFDMTAATTGINETNAQKSVCSINSRSKLSIRILVVGPTETISLSSNLPAPISVAQSQDGSPTARRYWCTLLPQA